jgi:hypothetical protein
MAGIASSTSHYGRHLGSVRRLDATLRQLQEMSEVTVREEGLLNCAQAGLVLDVSTRVVSDSFGYVSSLV